MTALFRLIANAFALWVAVQLVDGLQFDGSVWALLGIALIFGLVNAIVRPVVKLLSFPLLLLTLGLFTLVINALMFWIVIWLSSPDLLGLGLSSTGFAATFVGALIVTAVSWVLNLFIKED